MAADSPSLSPSDGSDQSLRPRIERVERNRSGQLVVHLAGQDKPIVDASVARCFPWSVPESYISIRSADGKEIALLKSTDELDQASRDDGKSVLMALDRANGQTVWESPRPVGSSWASPIVISTPTGDQIITCGNPWVIAYDPTDGREIWRANCLEGDGGPSPVFAGGEAEVSAQTVGDASG